jgi:predicted nuclease with RNAse H fold
MRIVAVDPAIKADNIGIALLELEERLCSFPTLSDNVKQAAEAFRQHWRDDDGGEKHAQGAACELVQFLLELQPNIVVVDAPKAFSRCPKKKRRAEKLLRTSAWTSYELEPTKNGFSGPALVRLGISIFDKFAQRGFARLQSPNIGIEEHSSIEVFPDASWQAFLCDNEHLDDLKKIWVAKDWRFKSDESKPSEHDLDAAVGGFTAIAALQGRGVFIGEPATVDDKGIWREGFIVIANPAADWPRNLRTCDSSP